MGINKPSLFSHLSSFNGSTFFGLDEMHLIARGIGKLVYDLTTTTISKDHPFYFDTSDAFSTYPFYITASDLNVIGTCITNSRKFIPVSFQGSFQNVIQSIEGMRAVDWLDYLLYIVPTIVVPCLPNEDSRKAMLALVRGCALALQWELNEQDINDLDRYNYN